MSEALMLQFGAAAMVGLFLLQVIDRLLKFKRNGPDQNGIVTAMYKASRAATKDEIGPALATVLADSERLRVSHHRATEILQALTGKHELTDQKIDQLLRHQSTP